MSNEATKASAGDAAPGPQGRRFRLGLSLKIVGIAGASIALVTVILAFTFARDVRVLLEEELTSRGRMAALALANTAVNLVLEQDLAGLDGLAEATLADVPGAAYVIVRDEDGKVTAEAALARLGDARPAATGVADVDAGSRVLERSENVGGEPMLHVVALVTFKGAAAAQEIDPLGLGTVAGAGSAGHKVLGTVELGFPVSALSAQIAAASRRALGFAGVAFAACLVVMFPLARFTTRPLTDLSHAALGIASGDLRQQVARSGEDEVSDLAASFGRMVTELQAMLGELKEAAGAMAQESDAMLAAATRQAALASQQSASVTEMHASIREIAQTSAAAIEHADRVIEATRSAEESSRAGERLVEDAVGSTQQVEEHVGSIGARLGELTRRAGQIGDTIGKVKDLALRSNVLALNAAIQASRAGEAGTSFSVIAREMRALAEQSSGTAGEVPRLLGEIAEYAQQASAATSQGSEKARSTAALAQKAGATITGLAGICRDSAVAARQISESARQQASGVNEIVAALSQLSEGAEGAVAGSEAMRRVAERLQSISGRLTELAGRYRS